MNKSLLQLIEVQAEIKIRLMKLGSPQAIAHVLAAELLDYIACSPITNEEHRNSYLRLSQSEDVLPKNQSSS